MRDEKDWRHKNWRERVCSNCGSQRIDECDDFLVCRDCNHFDDKKGKFTPKKKKQLNKIQEVKQMVKKQEQFKGKKIEEMYERIFLMIDAATNEIPEEERNTIILPDNKWQHWVTTKGFQKGLKKLFCKEYGLRKDYEIGDNDEVDEYADETYDEFKKRESISDEVADETLADFKEKIVN